MVTVNVTWWNYEYIVMYVAKLNWSNKFLDRVLTDLLKHSQNYSM